MALDDRSRRLYLRYNRGGVTDDAATYGSANYGDNTYGQEAGEPTITGIRYLVVPSGGWYPLSAAWQYRQGDTGKRFIAQIVNQADPVDVMDMGPTASAELILQSLSYGDAPDTTRFALTANGTDDTLERDWGANDLVAGHFAVLISVVFVTGRQMTFQTDDQVVLEVYEP